MDGTGSDDDQEAGVVAEDDLVDFLAGPYDEIGLGVGPGNLVQEINGPGQDAGRSNVDIGSLSHGGAVFRSVIDCRGRTVYQTARTRKKVRRAAYP